jgi:hypothetical protein
MDLTPEFVESAFALLDTQLDAMLRWCEPRGARLVVALLPEAAVAAGRASVATQLQPRALELVTRKQLPVIDLLPAMKAEFERNSADPVLPHDGHYDRRGNEVLANALSQLLATLLAERSARR